MTNSFSKLMWLIDELMSPTGCEWDKKQTPKSLRNAILEESYEIIDAINKDNNDLIKEEMGDILIPIMLIAKIKENEGEFNINNIIDGVCQKIIRRHPHIFDTNGNRVVMEQKISESEVVSQWESIKQKQEGKPKTDFKHYLPALERTAVFRKTLNKVDIKLQNTNIYENVVKNSENYNSEDYFGMRLFEIAMESLNMGIDPQLALLGFEQKLETELLEKYQ